MAPLLTMRSIDPGAIGAPEDAMIDDDDEITRHCAAFVGAGGESGATATRTEQKAQKHGDLSETN